MQARTLRRPVVVVLLVATVLSVGCHQEAQRVGTFVRPHQARPEPLGATGAGGANRLRDRRTAAGPRVSAIDSRRIREASGVVASRRSAGVFWTHGDSGTDSKIVAFDLGGKVLAEVFISDAPNIDWEDICADEEGHLYIGDIGDGGHSPVRCVYKIDEPDPHHPPAGPIKYLEKYEFRYPQERRFDAEALFAHDGELYVVAKSRWSSAIYRVRTGDDGETELERVTSLRVVLATGADVSADGKRLLIGSYFKLWVFPTNGSDRLVDASGVRSVHYQSDSRIEGCCFVGDDVLLVGEDGSVFRVTADEIEAEARLALRKAR